MASEVIVIYMLPSIF